MALKDLLKYFKNDNGYDVKVEKPDIDNNFSILADAIDETPFEKTDKEIYPKTNTNLGLVVGAKTIALDNSDDGDNKCFYDKATNSFRCGYVSDDRWEGDNLGAYSLGIGNNIKALGLSSVAIGKECDALGAYSISIGENTKSNFDYSTALGYGVVSNAKNAFIIGNSIQSNQPDSFGYGIYGDSILNKIIKHYNNVKTTDDTQTDMSENLILQEKSLFYILIHGVNVQDDYSTKWIFERALVVTIDSDKKITIVKDDNVDVVKDDSDWKFDITSTDGDDDNPPILTMKVTGKADTNIAWSTEVELKNITWD